MARKKVPQEPCMICGERLCSCFQNKSRRRAPTASLPSSAAASVNPPAEAAAGTVHEPRSDARPSWAASEPAPFDPVAALVAAFPGAEVIRS